MWGTVGDLDPAHTLFRGENRKPRVMADFLIDPLDSENFNAIDFINSKFPTEQSLEDLDTFSMGIGSQIACKTMAFVLHFTMD